MKKSTGLILLAVVAIGLALAAPAGAINRPERVIHAMDFFNARQATDGGFGSTVTPSTGDPVGTPWVMLAIGAARYKLSAWELGGKNPFEYQQSLDIQATANTQSVPPLFYALTILAYEATGKHDFVFHAGTKALNMPQELKAYQNTASGYYTGVKNGDGTAYQCTVTSWAIMALKEAGQSGSSVTDAVSWLAAHQNGDGGWGSKASEESNVDDTGLAVLALRAAGRAASDPQIADAITFIRGKQQSSGGFYLSSSTTVTNSESTAWAIQAGLAAGQDPNTWKKTNSKGQTTTPYTFIRSLQQNNGSVYYSKDYAGQKLPTTALSTIALMDTKLPVPYDPTSDTRRYIPVITSLTPAGGATLTSHSVAISAKYHDNDKETGIKTAAVTVSVDGQDLTRSAKIYTTQLSVTAKNLGNGQHSVTVKVGDYAGNTVSSTHKFTVNVPEPPHNDGSGGSHGGGGSGGGTYTPPPTSRPSTPAPTSTTPAPTVTLAPSSPNPYASPITTGSPDPYASSSPYPSLASSVSGGPIPASTSSGLDTASLIGGILIVLVPVGIGTAYLLQNRRVKALGAASHGKTLQGGGSPWERFKSRFSRGGR